MPNARGSESHARHSSSGQTDSHCVSPDTFNPIGYLDIPAVSGGEIAALVEVIGPQLAAGNPGVSGRFSDTCVQIPNCNDPARFTLIDLSLFNPFCEENIPA